MAVMMMEIDALAFTMMELMEMDSLMRILPLNTFRRLGFGGFSWNGFWSRLSSLLQRLQVNILVKAGQTHHGTVGGTVGTHRTMVVMCYRLNLVR